jgi:hypothetical protein
VATDAQRARRRAQRATAVRVRTRQTILPKSFIKAYKQAQIDQGYRWVNGIDPMPVKGSAEAKVAASLAGKARWGKADSVFETAFSQYWYHDDMTPEFDSDETYYDDEEDE